MSADAALAGVKKGSRVFIGSGCGEPQHLVENLVDRAIRLYDVEIIQVLAARDQAYTAERLAQHFRVKNFFVAGRGARGRHLGTAGPNTSPCSCPGCRVCFPRGSWNWAARWSRFRRRISMGT